MSKHTRIEKLEALGRILDTLDTLRVQCPWDRKQTNESLRSNTIEEVYELADALIKGDTAEIKKELGDVLLHVLFYSKIGEEKGDYDIADVADSLNKKLIYRHPHVFGDVTVNDSHDVEQNWEKIKLKEKNGNKTVLGGVPQTLPALIKAYRVQEKAANVGFDWPDVRQIWDKLNEEKDEFLVEVKKRDKEKMEAEFGDLIFTVVNLARHYGINPENALEKSNAKFIRRFNDIERLAKLKGLTLSEIGIDGLDELWNEIKRFE